MLDLLKKHFGYDAFRPLQAEVIEEVMGKRDTLVLMPTGGGKSLCYQLPALRIPGMTLVVSPLIALMKDQVDALMENGIAAAYLSHTLSEGEIEATMQKVARHEVKLLYVAPERFTTQSFRFFLREIPVGLIAIDEAHCISEWGHDFRPDYRGLSQLRSLFPRVPLIALTATANTRVREDILEQLRMTDAKVFVAGFNRPNLTYIIRPKQKAFEALVQIASRDKDASMIVYCGSRKDTERIAQKLEKKGLRALPYHAGLTPKIRTRTQEKFIRDEVTIIVATIAFGMGIDKPDVRFVVHMDFPKSVEAYYQETGRAGRDGLPSECIFFYSFGDRRKQEYFIRQISDEEEQRRAYEQLRRVMQYAESTACRRKFLLEYFGETVTEGSCGACDRCLGLIHQVSATIATASDVHQPLFEQLRVLRRRLAAEKGIAPYMVFGDRSLQDMARIFPRTPEAMKQVFGVGERKMTQFGQIFLRHVSAYADEHGLAECVPAGASTSQTRAPRSVAGFTHEETCGLVEEGLSLREIAERRGFSVGTIVAHLERLVEAQRLRVLPPSVMPFDRAEKITAVFRALNTWLLTPVREKLGEDFSFDELRWVRLKMKWEMDKKTRPESERGLR
ncbi:MAG: RecQ family ATP-dependent DNA helicase [Candidatus Uhrbacteria bacterium]|nr:RecQ family ATP-dependent DNA helicase [Candidatus Uhrbacteria bacterium]